MVPSSQTWRGQEWSRELTQSRDATLPTAFPTHQEASLKGRSSEKEQIMRGTVAFLFLSVFAAGLSAQTGVPPGTVLPVRLNSSVSQ